VVERTLLVNVVGAAGGAIRVVTLTSLVQAEAPVLLVARTR